MVPYVDTHLADVRAFLGPDNIPGRELIFREQNQKTGQLFAVRARRSNVAMMNIFMRKDWLDTLGLPVPTNPDEFFNALVAFKERNPGGVDNVAPFMMHKGLARPILEMFIDPNILAEDLWINTVGAEYMYVPGYKEGARFLNRMYNAGLVDPDFPLYGSSDIISPIASGRVGAFEDACVNIYQEPRYSTGLQEIIPNAEFVPVDAFPFRISYDVAGLSIFIPKSAKNPEGAMRYFNWLAKFENYNFLQIGPEGVTHDLVNGLPKMRVMPP